jgi:hypothetical protein
MIYEDAERIIELTLQTHWTKTPIDFDNVPYDSRHGQAFVRLQIEWYDGESIGPMRHRYGGYIMLSVFVPGKIGSRLSAQYIDQLQAIFYGLKHEHLQILPGRVQRVGDNREWYQRNLLIPFTYDYCKEVA